jgi:UDP-N-acetyl-L-fucosamine synthase
MKKNNLKICTILGTRPEIIRLSRVMSLLDSYVDHKIIHTGQNWDYELNEIFFKELGVRKPDHFLNINTTSLGTVLGETISKSEEVFRLEKPDAIIILGDTNSSISGIIAKRLKIPIYHLEAGNRSYDPNVPEDINRKIIDHISDFNLAYSEHARRNLLTEGIHPRRIYTTGSPMNEVLTHYTKEISSSDILQKLNLTENEYFLVSSHREENVDSSENLTNILTTLNQLSETYHLPVIVSTHPRIKNRMSKLTNIKLNENIQFLPPFGFFDYVFLQMKAKCTISDSGTISEESSILKFPAIHLRESTERPEAIDAGTMMITGLDPQTVLNSISLTIDKFRNKVRCVIPAEYQQTNFSWRVFQIILGTVKLSDKWSGIRHNDLSG